MGRLARGKVKEGLGDIAGGIPSILGAVALPGVGGALGGLLGKVGLGGVASAVGGLGGQVGGLLKSIPGVGKLAGLAGGDVGDFLKNNADLLLGGANAAMGINDLQNAGQYRKRALSRLETPARENLDPMFADPGNPYARPLRGVGRMSQ